MTESPYFDDRYPALASSSPPLQAIIVKPTPSPSPAPRVTQRYQLPPRTHGLGPPSSRVAKSSRRKTRPTQGDWVLLSQMDPNQPDIAQKAAEQALNSGSDSEKEDGSDIDLDDMEDTHSVNLERLATISLGPSAKAINGHRDSVIEDVRAFSPRPPSHPHGPAVPNGQRPTMSSTASPHLQPLAIPRMGGPDRLPALQAPSPTHDGSAASPHHHHPSLPPFRHLDDIARSATSEQDPGRPNGFPHRQSISSVGQSPTSLVRHSSMSSHAAASTPVALLCASSPMSASSDSQRGDIFLKTGGASVFGLNARRRSHAASENGPHLATKESYYGAESLTPGTQPILIEPRARHMSLDDALTSRVLPPPVGSGMQTMPSQAGSFKCNYPNCHAPPFQTQYLLNSHTNVHSQNRPHYCPVKECPRGEGGKGFKRKNEMIRHGLVHQSPGYVCPFCPDREHKYPRPDNLQRHVRVHHMDKDKDDAQLRDVLAQRPEGGSRGRRRRVSDSGGRA